MSQSVLLSLSSVDELDGNLSRAANKLHANRVICDFDYYVEVKLL